MTRMRGPTADPRVPPGAPSAYAGGMAKGKGKDSGAASRNRSRNGSAAAKPAASASAAAGKAKPEGTGTSEPVTAGGDTIGRLKPLAEADKKPTGPRTRPAPTKRTTPPASARYTPPVPRSEKVSPVWVPILMFACLGVGMLTIILNYVNVLPGPDPSNVYLMIGLGLITVGFITATKYH